MGDEEGGFAAGHFDCLFKDYDRGGAVDIVIAVDQDLLAARDGLAQPRDGFRHAAQFVGRVQVGKRRMEEAPGGIRIAQFTGKQDAYGRQADAEGGGQRLGLVCVGVGNQPAGLNRHASRQLFEK